jgi:putative phosphoribosyl transferase
MFENKQEALEKLINLIDKDVLQDCIILAISKNGEFYAKEIGLRNFVVEADYLFIEKIKSPVNKETSLAAISETRDYILVDELIDAFNITDDYLFSEIERVYEEKILQDLYQFRGGEGIISLEGKNVLLIDEGANTGLRLLCAIKSCISKKASSINVAVPVIAKETAEMIEKLVDRTFFVKVIEDFIDTKYYFKEYE